MVARGVGVLAPTDGDGLVGRLMRIGRRMAILCYKKVLQIIFSITAMDDHVALAFEMRHFASDSFREVPGFLHCVLADNQFFRHDRPLLDDHLFFADGNPDGLSHGQFDQCAH